MKEGHKPTQTWWEFKNGYGASVITDGYGSSEGLAELAVVTLPYHSLCYTTKVTSDVLGFLDDDALVKALNKVRKLPSIN